MKIETLKKNIKALNKIDSCHRLEEVRERVATLWGHSIGKNALNEHGVFCYSDETFIVRISNSVSFEVKGVKTNSGFWVGASESRLINEGCSSPINIFSDPFPTFEDMKIFYINEFIKRRLEDVEEENQEITSLKDKLIACVSQRELF